MSVRANREIDRVYVDIPIVHDVKYRDFQRTVKIGDATQRLKRSGKMPTTLVEKRQTLLVWPLVESTGLPGIIGVVVERKSFR